MNRHTGLIALCALPVLLLMACEPEGQRGTERAEAADAPPTQPQALTPYQSWDANQDRVLQRNEFAEWREQVGTFSDWVGDEGLDRERFVEQVHSAWDGDGDGGVTEVEWRMGVYPMLDDYGTWADWDADGDSELDPNEVAESLEAQGLYDVIDSDRDDLIDDEEIADFFYDVFDLNDNGEVDVTEWDTGIDTWVRDTSA